jgi:ribonuclease R
MQDKVGERFPGVVASVVDFGLFVELEPFFVEGLVKATDLGVGFHLDPKLHALVQPGTGRAFRIGDRLEVEVTAASPARRQVDLALVEHGEALLAPRPVGRRGEEGPPLTLREPGLGGARRGGRRGAPSASGGRKGAGRPAGAAAKAGKKGRGGGQRERGAKRRGR